MKIFLCFIIAFCCIQHLSAQDKKHSPYYFDSFKDAFIMYKDGRQYQVPVNYNMLTCSFFFKDTSDRDLIKELVDQEQIVVVNIDKESYLPSPDGLLKMLQYEPSFSILYIAQTANAPKALTYGGETQTAAVDSYSSLAGNFLTSGRALSNKIVVGYDVEYQVAVGRKTKVFYDVKSFVKLFPKKQRPTVENEMKDKNIDFQNPQEVLDLYNAYFKK